MVCQRLFFFSIDEADDSFQDYGNRRKEITPLLLQAIAKNQAKSLLTATEYDELRPVDYFCSSRFNPAQKSLAQARGKRFWSYNNQVTTACRNPAYARYIYGYYVWKHGLDGMASWTFQNTQNASGVPTLADGTGTDLYLAYPHPNGPLNTIKWEAIREGIDDHKLIYQLEKRIERLQELGIDSANFEGFLDEIRQKRQEPTCQMQLGEESNPSYFQGDKEAIISLIMEAEKQIKKGRKEERGRRKESR